MATPPLPDQSDTERGNIYFLTDDERDGVLWAISLGLAHDDGFSFPRDQNRVILRAARDRLAFPYRAALDQMQNPEEDR